MPITYQWRRDGAPISGATSATYTLDPLDEGTTVDCVVTASNNIGSDASVTVVAPRLISNNSLIGNYEWDYAWAANDAPSTAGDIPDYQGGIDGVLTSSFDYTTGESTGRLVAADIGSARVDAAIQPTTDGYWLASGLAAPATTDTIHVRVIFKCPTGSEGLTVSNTVLRILDSVNGNEHFYYLNNSTPSKNLIRFHSRTIGYTNDNLLTADIDTRNHWIIWDSYMDPVNNIHWQGINGQQYSEGGTPDWSGFNGNTLDVRLLTNNQEEDLNFLFAGIRIGDSFTFTEHRNDYLSTALEEPFPAVEPTISGALTVGSTLTADLGSWEGDQTTLSQEWKYVSDGTVVGSGTSYTLQAADAGETINLEVTGENSVAAGSDTDTFTVNGIEAVVNATLLNFEWDHAWLGSRNSGNNENLATIVEGSIDLALQSGTYTASQTTSPFTATDLGAEEDGALLIAGGGARWWSSDDSFTTGIGLTRHYRAIFSIDSLASNSRIFSYGTNSDEGYLSVEVDNTGSLRVRNFMGSTNSIEVGFAIEEVTLDTGWHLLDVVIGPDDSDTLLRVYIDGKEFFKRDEDQVYIPPNGNQFAVGAVNGLGGLSGDFLFAGWRTSDFTYAEHFSDWVGAGIATDVIDEYTWDLAWDFTDAPATPGTVPAYAGAFDLTLDTGTYTVGGSTGGLTSELIGSGRVDDALVPGATCTMSTTITDMTTNYDTGFDNGYHLRFIVKKPEADGLNSVTAILLGSTSGADAIQINFGAFNDDTLLVRSRSNSLTVQEQINVTSINDWMILDVLQEVDNNPTGVARRLRFWINGQEVSGDSNEVTTTWAGFTLTNLDLNFARLKGVLFLGIRTIAEVNLS